MGLEPKVSRRAPALPGAMGLLLRLALASGWLSLIGLSAVAEEDSFRWPVSGRVIVDFANSRGTGINIEVPEGSAVRATEKGLVIYAGSGVEGYGNLLLIRHANGYVSAYAHLREFAVAKGDVVLRGQSIGAAGMTGSVVRPQLHFELRKGANPVDPIPLLAGGDPTAPTNADSPSGETIESVIEGVTAIENIGSASGLPIDPADPAFVAKAQRGLASLGFLHGPADGIAGNATKKAVRNFQVYYNFEVTGTVTTDLLDQLADNGANF